MKRFDWVFISKVALLFALLIGVQHVCCLESQAQLTCGDTIISPGDSQAKLIAKCGLPDWISEPSCKECRRCKPAQTYYYNRGPDKWIKRVFIQNGKVEEIGWLDLKGW